MTEEEKRFHEEVAGRLFEMRDAAGMTQEKLAGKKRSSEQLNPPIRSSRPENRPLYCREGGRCS